MAENLFRRPRIRHFRRYSSIPREDLWAGPTTVSFSNIKRYHEHENASFIDVGAKSKGAKVRCQADGYGKERHIITVFVLKNKNKNKSAFGACGPRSGRSCAARQTSCPRHELIPVEQPLPKIFNRFRQIHGVTSEEDEVVPPHFVGTH